MTMIKIGGVERFSLVDFPEQVAAVIFMQGCPWRCPFCYNTHLQSADKDGTIDCDKFFGFLEKRRGVLDAVVFSGGEPLLQPELVAAVKRVKEMGFKIGLHSGGYNPEAFARVLPLLDWVGFDIKAPFVEARYQRATGSKVPLKNVLTSFDMLIGSGKTFETRTTCDPRLLGVNDIYTIADSLKARGVENYHLQKYRPIPADTESTEKMCNAFFEDKALLSYLQNSFKIFDIRS